MFHVKPITKVVASLASCGQFNYRCEWRGPPADLILCGLNRDDFVANRGLKLGIPCLETFFCGDKRRWCVI